MGGFHQEGGGFLCHFPSPVLSLNPLEFLTGSCLPGWHQGLAFLGISWPLGTLSWGRSTSMVAVGSPWLLWIPSHWLALLPEMPLWVSHFFGYYRRFGFQKPQWEHTSGLHSRTSGAHSPKVVGLLVLQPFGSLSPRPGEAGSSPGQREDMRHICGQERLSRSDQCDLGFKSQQFLLLCQKGEVLGSEVLCREGEEGESQHMEGLLTLLQRQGYARKRDPLGRGRRDKSGGCWEQPAGASG